MRVILTSILFLSLTGCSSLIVRDADDPLLTTAKVATRVLIYFPSLMTSEIMIDQEKKAEQREAESARYARWFNSLSPEEKAIERQLEGQRDLMRMQAAALTMPALMYNANQSFNSMRMPAPQPFPYQPIVQSPPSVSCRSYPIGNNLYTDCR